MDGADLSSALKCFIGTTQYYAHWTRQIVYTEGVSTAT